MSARRMRAVALGVAAVVVAGVSWAGASVRGRGVQEQRPFPHAEHVGLFPTCKGCHAGIEEGDPSRWLTAGPENCAECHDGVTEKRVAWTQPERPATNLHFDHVRHAGEMQEGYDSAAVCTDCHRQAGGTKPMQVVMARPELCIRCHEHRASEHLALAARCSTCHLPLGRAGRLTAADIADFPEPSWHHREDFLFGHGDLASQPDAQCSVCHARESCTRCHLNASRVAAIRALPEDSRIAQLVTGRRGQWPEPASHRREGWSLTHGQEARASLATCANCHAASSCATCHTGPRAGFLARLPEAVKGGPTGVRLTGGPPGHGPGFATQHGAAAASGALECSACHTAVQCTACHRGGVPSTPALGAPGSAGSAGGDADGPDGPIGLRPDTAPEDGSGSPTRPSKKRPVVWFASLVATRTPPADTTPPATSDTSSRDSERGVPSRQAAPRPPRTGGFHPPDYVLQHGADAFARQTQCSECHNAQAFCLACHRKMGVGRQGPIGTPAYHDAEPDWLLVHGRAARQNMETCTSCHTQDSCLRCHSARSGWRVSPHGPGFDPNRIADRSTISCGVCHFSVPGRGGG